MKTRFLQLTALGLALLVLSACGLLDSNDLEPGQTTPVGDVALGETLFSQPTIGANEAPGCITCHSLEPDVVIVGPSQAGLATRAASRLADQTAEVYIRNSIANPAEYIVEGFAEKPMYPNYSMDLTPEEIDALVAYGLTLK